MRPSICTAVARPTRSMRDFLADQRATTAIEYALLASCVAVAVAAIIVTTGSTLTEKYQKIHDAYPS